MTLRQWVESSADKIAPRAVLEAFETGLVEAEARAEEDGMPPGVVMRDDVEPELWEMAFRFCQAVGAIGTRHGTIIRVRPPKRYQEGA